MQPPRYKHYLLGVLLLTLAFNKIDLHALGLVLQDIKTDLALSDTQLGFMTGLSYAVFYAIMGIPIARWADRGNRVKIMTVTTVLWSAALALCGVATSFPQLLAIRAGVAVGEAGCVPPACSLIADYFSRAERPRAVAIYMLGTPLSTVIGYFLAGWLNEHFKWRLTFVLLGLPGLLLAVLIALTLREPRLEAPATRTAEAAAVGSAAEGFKEACTVLWTNVAFRQVLFSFSIMYFFSFGIWQWAPTFFIRSYGLRTGELGTWFALIWGGCGLVGTYLGGAWATRYAAQNERLQLRVMALIYGGFGMLSMGVYLSSNRYVALAFMGLAALGVAMAHGPLFATLQTIVPPRLRATSVAVVYLFANLIGMGLGPLATGVLSDALRPWAAEDSLRYALLVLCPGYAWCGWHLWRAGAALPAPR